jgi:hypothetical protein
MAAKRDDATEDDDREARIAEMKEALQEAAGGKMVAWESPDLPADQRQQFWRNVLAFENGPFTTDAERLAKAGIELPEAASMDDATLTAKLWEVIRALARLRVFISQTDHLTDRELYEHLRSESLREEIPMDCHPDSTWHVDPLGSGSEEDSYLYLKFYADEKERKQWLDEFPDYVMPDHEDPPYDRDRHLPEPYDRS